MSSLYLPSLPCSLTAPPTMQRRNVPIQDSIHLGVAHVGVFGVQETSFPMPSPGEGVIAAAAWEAIIACECVCVSVWELWEGRER